jgi:ribose 5-phosphate isomerase B
MTANKYSHVRAALCWTEELAEMGRLHNNANILCIPVRYVSEATALAMLKVFLDTEFEGGRHQRRVSKIAP